MAATLLAGAACIGGRPAPSVEDRSEVEEIFVLRSWREAREAPTEFCAPVRTKLGAATSEDRYSFRSVAVRALDGRLIEADGQRVGALRACFTPTIDPAVSGFYAEGDLGEVSFVGRGECRRAAVDHPEPGLTPYHCFLALSGLPVRYAGGQLTTNTLNSRQLIGGRSDPAGYVQPSIATVRLWRRR